MGSKFFLLLQVTQLFKVAKYKLHDLPCTFVCKEAHANNMLYYDILKVSFVTSVLELVKIGGGGDMCVCVCVCAHAINQKPVVPPGMCT
jgi:hypothetical protein